MLRIALPKGRLFRDVRQLFWNIGIKINHTNVYNFTVEDYDFSIKKVRAIPQLISLGNYDIGFCGLDLVRETNYDNVIPLIDLQLNKVKIVAAEYRRGGQDSILKAPTRPIVIATEYENLADHWAFKRKLEHITIQTWGSTEGYAPRDADIVFDCVETGDTLAANGLVVVDEIMTSSTYLVANRSVINSNKSLELGKLIHRILESK